MPENRGRPLTEIVTYQKSLVGFIECEICGAAILLDQSSNPGNAIERHNAWHDSQREKIHDAATRHMQRFA